jgi:hypothetical protein
VVGTDHDPKTGAPRALLARNDSGGLIYAGAAFIALGGDKRAAFFAELERLCRRPMPRAKLIVYVPSLPYTLLMRIEAQPAAETPLGLFRATLYRELGEDGASLGLRLRSALFYRTAG